MTSMKTLIFIDPTIVFLPRVMKWKCWNLALSWTRKLNLNVRRTMLFLEFHLCIQHLLFEHRKRCFFHRFLTGSALWRVYFISFLDADFSGTSGWNLKVKIQKNQHIYSCLAKKRFILYSAKTPDKLSTWYWAFKILPDCIFHWKMC